MMCCLIILWCCYVSNRRKDNITPTPNIYPIRTLTQPGIQNNMNHHYNNGSTTSGNPRDNKYNYYDKPNYNDFDISKMNKNDGITAMKHIINDNILLEHNDKNSDNDIEIIFDNKTVNKEENRQ